MQTVNLYLPEFRPKNEPLLSGQIALITLLTIVLFTFISVWGAYKNSGFKVQLAAQEVELSTIDSKLAVLRASLPKRDTASLERENIQLTKGIERRRSLQRLLATQNLGNAGGFSAQLEGLARQKLDTLALHSFSLLNGGRYLEMSGSLTQAHQLPRYLQSLRTEPAFTNSRFGVMNIDEEGAKRGQMKFELKRPVRDES